MTEQKKKPSFQTYKKVMIPHILPIRAKELGISSENKEEWKILSKLVRNEVIKRYQTIEAETLWADMQFKRYNQKRREQKQARKAEQKKQSKNSFNQLKEFYKMNASKLPAQIVVFDDPEESAKLIDNIHCQDERLRNWIGRTRRGLLQKTSRINMEYARAIANAGFRVIMTMPVVTINKIYFCHIYIPALKLAIDISDNPSLGWDNEIEKNNNLLKVGIKRIRLSKTEAKSPVTFRKLMENISK